MKRIISICVSAFIAALPFISPAQEKDTPKANWFNLDLQTDGVFGISTEKAYDQLLKNKKGQPVVVAVIDGGVDYNHEDLKDIIWINPKEIKGNGKDDDGNGYADDINGWDFIGSTKGSVQFDNLEMVRLIRKYQPKYESVLNSTPLEDNEKKEFQLYKKLVTDYMENLEQARGGYENTVALKRLLDTITAKIAKPEPTLADFEAYKPNGDLEPRALRVVKSALKKDPSYDKFYQNIKDGVKYYNTQLKYNLNLDFDPRDSIGDNYADSKQRNYGNADVKGPDAEHGTHVSGIIGAIRTNNIGIKGVANNVRIMAVRTVPTGDERDKDVANAIIYAVDNGAKVINMSFGKSYSWDKKAVDEAVKYAESKDVLLVHAAGNDGKNIDKDNNFPTRIFADDTDPNYWNLKEQKMPSMQELMGQSRQTTGMGGRPNINIKIPEDTLRFTKPKAANWIEVGASGWKNDENLVASFSNYGKRSVDVFAPGEKINSTMPESKYKENDGTSMASPVVAGLAALIRSYYPALTAVQVKDLIVQSVSKVDYKVKVKENDETKKVLLSEISTSGGVVNAFNALSLAQKLYGQPGAKK